MKLLFFDMEFADGRVPGSIYSIGYLVTDENFEIIVPPTDLLINPDSTWNEYVKANILAYPKETVEAAPTFPALYSQLKKLFEDADVAVGFAVNNDTRALCKDCERYDLEPFRFRSFDTEKLCKKMEEYPSAHGLKGYVLAWCGEEPEHCHRSDGDAYATMQLLRAVCHAKHVTADMMIEAYPECVGSSLPVAKKVKVRQGKGSRRKKARIGLRRRKILS